MMVHVEIDSEAFLSEMDLDEILDYLVSQYTPHNEDCSPVETMDLLKSIVIGEMV